MDTIDRAAERARGLWSRGAGPLSTTAYLGLGIGGTIIITLVAGTGTSMGGYSAILGGALAAAAGSTLTLLLVWRRRWPVPLAIVSAVGCLVAWTYAAAWLALFALAVRRRDRWLAIATVIAWAGSILSATVLGFPLASGFWLSTSMYGFAVAGGAYVGSRRALMESLRERAERAEGEQLLRSRQARLAERSRIAQEMHDVLAHKISLVTLQAGGLEVNPTAGPDEVERVAGLIRTTARQALEDLRGVLGVLRGVESSTAVLPPPTGMRPVPGLAPPKALAPAPDLTPQPGMADVRALVESSRSAGVPVHLDWDVPDDAPVPELLGRTAFRVLQEALTNVHKHSHGVSASVLVRGRPGERLDIEVTNPRPVGTAVEPLLPGTGTGLEGLSERVRLAGGQVEAGPTPEGFRVRAWLPWAPVPGRVGPVPR